LLEERWLAPSSNRCQPPFLYAGVAIVLGLVALVATYIPVRRATRIDPVVALHLE